MAGDWMKIELELPDKPEVHAMANTLNLDPDSIVGKLIRVWQWFDKHTVDGNAYGVTYSLPDRITGVTGFGEAMMFVGWLEQNDKTLTMPKFDRHTSQSAKQRALTAKRVANNRVKSNANSNDDSVTTALPREEKRREDIKTPDFVNQDLWDDFLVMRKELKAKNTPRAIKLLVTELQRLVTQGNDANKVIENSIRNSWKDVYAIKANVNNEQPKAKSWRDKIEYEH
jgi:hypothetical protein